MKTEDELLILAHTQYVARFYGALKCSLDKIVELVRYSAGPTAPPADAVALFLRKETTRDKLEQAYETAFWESSDRAKSWRLVSLALPTDLDVCKQRLNKRPPSHDCCAFCWIDERGFDREILLPELDAYSNPIPGLQLHRACARSWRRLRNTVERNQ